MDEDENFHRCLAAGMFAGVLMKAERVRVLKAQVEDVSDGPRITVAIDGYELELRVIAARPESQQEGLER